MKHKLKCVFMGTPEFCLPSLQTLATHPDLELTHIVSMPDRPAGRGQKLQSPSAIEFAKNQRIDFLQTKNINHEKEFLSTLEDQKIDLIIVLAFAQFLGRKILELPRLGCFNIHTSLLPKYRGAAPIQHAVLNGDEVTGVTIQKMVKKMDAGDVVHQDQIILHERETGASLNTRLSFQAALSLNQFITNLSNKNIDAHQQDHEAATFAPSLTRDMGLLDFQHHSAIELERRVRAFFPWPGTYCFMNNKRLKVLSAQLSDEKLDPMQTLITKDGELFVGTKAGALRLDKIQLEGKKASNDSDFFRTLNNKEKYYVQTRPNS